MFVLLKKHIKVYPSIYYTTKLPSLCVIYMSFSLFYIGLIVYK